MNILYFDCFSGISGDMTVAALLDLGLPFDYLKEQLLKLNLSGYALSQSPAEKHKISAVKFNVLIENDKSHRHLNDILSIIDAADLPEKVKDISRRVFRKLAEAEAKVHNTAPEKVHFHEVGGVDAIIDIVGSAIGITYFSPDLIFSSAFPLGRGIVRSEHGMIPIPAPATVEILRGFPVRREEHEGERVTPTGAAILTTLLELFGTPEVAPEFTPLRVGYGAGAMDFPDRPNLLRLILGEVEVDNFSVPETIEVLETNIDDMNPQVYDYLLRRLYSAGAAEVFIAPIIMKKSRPGNLLTVLCKKDLVDKLSDIIFRETSTAGIRFRSEKRKILDREIKTVETDYGPIQVKILKIKDGIKIQPEYDDCSEAAMRCKAPLLKVMEAARTLAGKLEGIK
jgi:pyridinium-3,5-bisthiocarboxylic acid mononucleotide nickel chelatase